MEFCCDILRLVHYQYWNGRSCFKLGLQKLIIFAIVSCIRPMTFSMRSQLCRGLFLGLQLFEHVLLLHALFLNPVFLLLDD